jgi:lipid A ethanolaminephosphotransferase
MLITRLIQRVKQGLTSNALVLGVTIFMVLAGNATLFSKVYATYGLSLDNALEMASLPVFIGAVMTLLLALFAFGRLTKPFLALILVLSSLAAYFMDNFGVVIDEEMLHNVAQTNTAEAADLVNVKAIAYFTLLGVLPAALLLAIPMRWRGWRLELRARLKLLAGVFVTLALIIAGFSAFYYSFFREHKPLRTYTNPVYYVYSAIRYLSSSLAPAPATGLVAIAMDAHIPASDTHRELIVIVVGEAARADRFSLNGYARETNPLLSREQVISFGNFWSCGTSTGVSVPCMFSSLGREDYEAERALHQENVIDVAQRAGAHVLWLDNNSDSKGVATRVPSEDFRVSANNPACDTECRDVGMLPRLKEFIDSHPTGDVVVVLHQMGNHGPAYYKRYPPDFEKFKPACQSNDLSQCSKDEIGNAYDNAILYTDHFLAKLIETLKRYDDRFETAMFYLSDHGESLGENGVYLHGFPYALAPEAQRHVAAILWFGQGFDDVDLAALRKKQGAPFSHDNLFHTLLGLLEIDSTAYRKELDILDGARNPNHP